MVDGVKETNIDMDGSKCFFKAVAVVLAFWFIWGALDHAVDKICETQIEVTKIRCLRSPQLPAIVPGPVTYTPAESQPVPSEFLPGPVDEEAEPVAIPQSRLVPSKIE